MYTQEHVDHIAKMAYYQGRIDELDSIQGVKSKVFPEDSFPAWYNSPQTRAQLQQPEVTLTRVKSLNPDDITGKPY